MQPKVYIETSIIGYLAMRPSAHLITAANQQVSHDFWDNHRQRFDLYISQAEIGECAAGDPQAAAERSVYLKNLMSLVVDDESLALAAALISSVPLPEKARIDAAHISVAAVNGMNYLLTWNCAHIANPALRVRIESICWAAGYRPPVICTPPELIEVR